MIQSESDTLTFIWMRYSYHLDRKLTPQLQPVGSGNGQVQHLAGPDDLMKQG